MKHSYTIILSLLLLPISSWAQCPSGEIEVAIQVLTDNFGYETEWALSTADGTIITSGGAGQSYEDNTWYGDTVCVDASSCLRFEIFDSFGDGICCGQGNGVYNVFVDGESIATGGDFGNSAFHLFNCPPGSTCGDALTVEEGTHTAPSANTWYVFTPTENGTYGISACDNDCDSRIWVYDYCEGLAWADDNTGTIYYDDDQGGCGPQAMIGAALLEGGHTYYIRIGTDDQDCNGSIDWNLTYNGPVEGCTDPAACNYNPLATVSTECIYPGDPSCPDGPDLIVDQDVLSTSMYLSSMNVPQNDCQVEEGCMNGYGMRDILRFTTHIRNIGNMDYFIGNPSENPDQFEMENCHNHTHYKGYAKYTLFEMDGTELPIGFKNGFCVMDLECSGGGTAQYGCSMMGISAGCGDIYSSGLSCQWIDITDVDTGVYTFVNSVNWDNDPDALGHYELSHMNNWAQVCIYIGRDENGEMFVEQVEDCEPYVDCAGELYGNAQPDCNGDCGGSVLRGDLNSDTEQNMLDAQQYVQDIIGNDISPSNCNDLNADGDIDVYDASLIADCYLSNDGHITGSNHDHCNFPYGVTNIYDTVELSIGAVNYSEQYIDVHIKNPDNFVVGYQFDLSGVQITSVENLIPASAYPATPNWSMGSSTIIGLSYQDSLIPKHFNPAPLVRVHYFSLTDTLICINNIRSVVNQNYEETMTQVDAMNACLVAYTGIEEQQSDGGVSISVAPNPMRFTTELRINNRYSLPISVQVVSPTGAMVRDLGHVTSTRVVLDRNDLSAGMYFIQVTDGKRVLTREKLMVR